MGFSFEAGAGWMPTSDREENMIGKATAWEHLDDSTTETPVSEGRHDGFPPNSKLVQIGQTSSVPWILKDRYSSDGEQRKHELGSKALVSERKRRQQLNEGLYTLRSLVPNISKMDKASIVSDAIGYVQDLRKQIEDIQAEISALQPKDVNSHHHSTLITSSTDDKLAHDDPADDEINTISFAPLHSMRKEADKQDNEFIILQVDVSEVEEKTFCLRIHCKKARGVLTQLTRALESLQLDFRNANLTSFDGHLVKTVIAETERWAETIDAEKLKQFILGAASNFDFQIA